MAEQPPEVYDVIAKRASDVGASLLVENIDWNIRGSSDEFFFNSVRGMRQLEPPNLQGQHQLHNAGVAVAAMDRLDNFNITDEVIKKGFTKIEWPARLQQIRQGFLQKKIGDDFTLWLDGGHNVGAAKAIRNWASKCENLPLHLVLGMINTKDPRSFLGPLKEYINSLYTVTIEGEAATWTKNELCAHAQAVGINAIPAADVVDAIENIVKKEIGPARILIAGSLYLAGKVLSENNL